MRRIIPVGNKDTPDEKNSTMPFLVRKDGPIWLYKVDNFIQLRECVENEISFIEDYVFRGQSNSEWGLTSTLYRLIHRARKSGAKQGPINKFVKLHLDRFKLEIRGRRGDNPPKLEDDELWALGQHFGLATPLLDWSQSPYISIFFSLQDFEVENDKRVLWCLNKRMLEGKNKGLSESNQLKLLFPDTDDNKRLLGQSGLFSKGPVMSSVDDWVKKNFKNSHPVLLKIEFPSHHSFRKMTLKKLNLMNINYSTLFPDLVGAGRYCNVVSEDYEA